MIYICCKGPAPFAWILGNSEGLSSLLRPVYSCVTVQLLSPFWHAALTLGSIPKNFLLADLHLALSVSQGNDLMS